MWNGTCFYNHFTVLCNMWATEIRQQTEGNKSPQGSEVKRSHTSCCQLRRTPADFFTGSFIVQIYHAFHWCGLSQRPLKTKAASPQTRCFIKQCSLSQNRTKYMKDEAVDNVWGSTAKIIMIKHSYKWKYLRRYSMLLYLFHELHMIDHTVSIFH